MKTIADELVAALDGIPEVYHEINPRPAPLDYPYVVFNYSYAPVVTDRDKYQVTLELDLFDDGPTSIHLLELEEEIVDALGRYRAMRDNAWSMATLDVAVPVPTLVDNLHRRHVQFTINMTLRKKV